MLEDRHLLRGGIKSRGLRGCSRNCCAETPYLPRELSLPLGALLGVEGVGDGVG